VRDQRGFTVIETMVALGLIAVTLVGMASTVTTGIKGVVTSRQRVGATAIADDLLEKARGRAYLEVGHDFNSDTTLATDTALTGTSPNYSYNGEVLAASVLNGNNPPFSPHRWTVTRDGTPYTVKVYVTTVTPAFGAGDAYKRVTVKVTWGNIQFAQASTNANTVKVSSFVFPAVQPPDPLLDGVSEADAGTLTLTGSLKNLDLNNAKIWWPFAHGEVASHFIKSAKGYGNTLHDQINLNSGALSGCTLSNGSTTADCFGSKSDTFADNDAGTSPNDYDAETVNDTGGSITSGGPLIFTIGSGGSTKAESAARSSSASTCSGILGNDLLPYHCSDVFGPTTTTFSYQAGSIQGKLLNTTGVSHSTSLLDRADSAGAARLSVTSTTSRGATDIMTVQNGPSGFSGAVRVPATSVSTFAASGIGASPPSVTAAGFTVQLWDTVSGTPQYRSVAVTPGTPLDTTATATMDVNSETITLTTTFHVGSKASTSTTAGGAIVSAEASLTNWMWAEVHVVVIKDDDHTSDGDFVLHVDYGRVSSQATYQAVT
jgi:type II secretory pathway pseudopilin PulG